MNYSRKVVIFVLGKHETALVGYAGLCPDSAIQSSLMALAAPSVRQSLSNLGSALAKSQHCKR